MDGKSAFKRRLKYSDKSDRQEEFHSPWFQRLELEAGVSFRCFHQLSMRLICHHGSKGITLYTAHCKRTLK
jgi:hypothetical protein